MAAPKGNQFWKLAKNAGRPRIYKSPDELWREAEKYFQWVDDNPIEVEDNKGTKHVNIIKYIRPYTWEGLELFLGVESLREYKTNYKEFSQVITRMEKIIYSQKFQGAAIGIFNSNLIARDLGISDKQEHSHQIEEIKITRE